MAWDKKQKLKQSLDDAKLIVQLSRLQTSLNGPYTAGLGLFLSLHPTTGFELLPFTATTPLLIFMS